MAQINSTPYFSLNKMYDNYYPKSNLFLTKATLVFGRTVPNRPGTCLVSNPEFPPEEYLYI